MRKYVKGVYRTSEDSTDSGIDVIIFDGKKWWLPGWEIGLKVSNFSSAFTIKEDDIKELLWEWKR